MRQLLAILFASIFSTVLMAHDSCVNKTALLKEMFSNMVVKKNAALIPKYYHKNFILHSNGKSMDYLETVKFHTKIYKTNIKYGFKYQDESFVESKDRVAGRIFITTETPPEAPKEIELIIIVQYKDNKIYRAWELSYPDWSKMKSFKKHL